MNVVRNEVRTGLLVLVSLTIFVGVLIYLGAPGVFTPQKEFAIYFDNAAGMKIGTQVMLAGRKIGQVTAIASPVPNAERPVGPDGKRLPMEARITVRVDQRAAIYKVNRVSVANYNLLTEQVIDFTEGDETSGLAPEGHLFVGERPSGLGSIGAQILEKVEPVLQELTATLKSLQNTTNNLTRITNDGADLPRAIGEIRRVAANLNELSGPESSLRKSLDSIERLVAQEGKIAGAVEEFRKLLAPEGDLAKSLANVEKFTRELRENKDIDGVLKNLRAASDRLNYAITDLNRRFGAFADNLEQGADTLKRQPWRLIWPSTKKYPDEEPTPRPKVLSKPSPAPKGR